MVFHMQHSNDGANNMIRSILSLAKTPMVLGFGNSKWLSIQFALKTMIHFHFSWFELTPDKHRFCVWCAHNNPPNKNIKCTQQKSVYLHRLRFTARAIWINRVEFFLVSTVMLRTRGAVSVQWIEKKVSAHISSKRKEKIKSFRLSIFSRFIKTTLRNCMHFILLII